MPEDDSNDITRSYLQLSNGTIIGHYRIIEKIGAGGMGEVYLAEDTSLSRKVALKFLPPHLCHDADYRARFQREAQAAAKLSHPNVITIHEVSEYNGRPYFVMEHIGGEALADFIKKHDQSIEKIIDLSIQICEGLNKAHQAGIIHRDIKPSNVLIDNDGRAKILDFGLAAIEGTDKLTRTGSTMGTLHYMSPEQTRGEEVDHRSDIFSFGAVLYEMITGQRPFKGDHEPAILYAIGYEEPEPLARYKTGVPDELQRIVGKMLAKDRSLRYQHADELLADLKRLILSVDDSRRVPRLPTDVTQSIGSGAASTSSQAPFTADQSSRRFPIPKLPRAPQKAILIAGFLVALAGMVLLTISTPRPLRYNSTVTTSPTDAEEKSLSLLKDQNISLFGFDSHTYATDDNDLIEILRDQRRSRTDLEALEPWSPTFYYLTRVVSADGRERYDIGTSGNGIIFSFAHSLRPDTRLDTISSDSARSVAHRFSEDVFGVRLSNLKEMPISVTKSAEGTMTSLQWVMENNLPGDAVAEVRASFAGPHLTDIRRKASFSEVVKISAGASTDVGRVVSIFLAILAFVLLIVVASRERAWHFPSWKLILFIALTIVVLSLLMVKPMYYGVSPMEPGDAAVAAVLVAILGFCAAVFLILAFASGFGILERKKPDLLSGLQEAPAGKIAGETVLTSSAIGMVAGGLAVIAHTLYMHLILSAYAMDLPLSFEVFGGTRLTETVEMLTNVIMPIGVISVAIASAVIFAKYLRSGIAGWLLVAIVWASTDGSFLSPDGMMAWLALANLLPVAVSMLVVWRYNLLAGILTWSGYEILTSGLSLSSFGTGYFRSLGYTWLGIWFLIAAISIYYVIRKAAPERLKVS